MPTSEEHYRNLLSSHYSWMFGLSFNEKVAEQRALLEPLLADTPRGLAVDLGCGPGFQSFALAQLGFGPIHALDMSVELLAELETHRHRDPDLPIYPRTADILRLGETVAPISAATIVCMGDTLTHLPSYVAVRELFSAAATALVFGGLFVLTWRDLTSELTGTDRFISVRSSADKIITCFLEYTTSEAVQVHDLIYTRDGGNDTWTLAKSSYPKLRLAPAQVASELAAAGFKVEPFSGSSRLSLVLARKTPLAA